MIPDAILHWYALARNIQYEGRSRETFFEDINSSLDDDMDMFPPESVLDQISRWLIDEVLEPIGDENWSNEYFTEVRKLERITEDLI